VLITFINIIGGLIIGVLQKGMPFAEAAKTYTILTVGDGLVTQMPALLISTAAGIVVSRAGMESDLGKDITKQVFFNPKALATAAGVMGVLGLVPGLPHLPFFLLSAGSGALAYAIAKPEAVEEKEERIKPVAEEPPIETFIEIEPLTFEIGYGLIPLVESEKTELLNKIKAMRRQLASELGFVVPSIHIKDNLQLRPHEYSFLIRGIEVARGEVMMGHFLAVASGETEKIEGVPTKEPAFGLPAYWISEKDVETAQTKGYMVVDIATVITTHVTELIKSHAWELLTRTEVRTLLDSLSKNYPKIVDELIPSTLTFGNVQRVLQNLLRERVPINDLVTILETLLDTAVMTKDTELLTEYVRQALSRYISRQHMSAEGDIRVMTLDPVFERHFSQALEDGGAISPGVVNKLMSAVETAVRDDKFRGALPVILCSTQVRRFLRKITERFMPSLVILSNAEISPSVRVTITGVLRYED
jgi:flagellar biosynthesis protein FlhA